MQHLPKFNKQFGNVFEKMVILRKQNHTIFS